MYPLVQSILAFAVLSAVSTICVPAPAQEEPVPEAAEVTPPRLVTRVPSELSSDREVAVLLELTVDEAGRVSDVIVVESGGQGFDQAAVDAAQRFAFEPARREGGPVTVRVRYRYVFPARPQAAPVRPPVGRRPQRRPEPDPAAAATAPDAALTREAEYGATAEILAPSRSVTRRSMPAERLAKVPGATGDALVAVEMLPGVARSDPFGDPSPVVRGAAQNESRVFLDGIPVPLLFHISGNTSFFQSRLLERVDLYPGNFSVRYGRVTAGIIDARTREPRRDRFHGMLQLSLLDTSVLAEAPIGEEAAVALAARRSNIDFFFEQFVPEDTYSVVAAPVYYDYQAMLAAPIGRAHRLRLMLYGSDDRLELLLSDPAAEDPSLRGTIAGHIGFHHLGARLESRLSPEVSHMLQVTGGFFSVDQQIGPFLQALDVKEIHGRSEWSVLASRAVTVDVGLDVSTQLAGGRYVGPQPRAFEGDPQSDDPLSQGNVLLVEDDDIDVIAPAAFAELSLRPVESVSIVPGVRADYFANVDSWTVDPRLSARVELTDATALKAGVGLFSQPPEFYEALPEVGNPDIEPYRALQLAAGVEQELGAGIDVGVEGFYKRLFNRIVGTEGGIAPHFVNDGRGRIYGAELSVAVRPSPSTFGYIAYTLSRSERQDRNEPWRLFDHDQTHVLSAVFAQDLGARWEVGARFRLVSGNPTTPVIGAVYDARIDQYRAVYGPVNSEREPLFHQLDLRVEKSWRVSYLTIAAFVELINAYAAEHVEGTRYSFDYSESEPVTGLPIFPNFGVRGEL